MKIFAISYTKTGYALSIKLADILHAGGYSCRIIYCPRGQSWVKDVWEQADGLIFIGAAGIAVRMIAPFVKDKRKDPAVLVLDEKGEYVIPLLSGHAGGANALAKFLAERLAAQAALTTATDVQGLFAVDVFAAENDLVLTNWKLAKEISARILDKKRIGFYSAFPITGNIPPELEICESIDALRACDLGVAALPCPDRQKQENILELYPRNLTVGMGCKKDVPFESLRVFMEETLAAHGFIKEQAVCLASIDKKREETGLRKLAEYLHVPFVTWTAEELNGVEAEKISEESDFVRRTVGVGNVCERAAYKSGGGAFVIRKQSRDGMTLAAVKKDRSVKFA